MTPVTVPVPTVRPPSRMAKRMPSSMAAGLDNSISRRDLFHNLGQPDGPGHVRGAEVKLWAVAVEEGGVAPPFLFLQYIHLGLEPGVRVDRPVSHGDDLFDLSLSKLFI